MTRSTRLANTIALVVGVFMIVSPFALDYPTKTQGVDDLTDSLRGAMTDEALAQTRHDMDTVNAFVSQFEDEAAPAIAGALTDAGVLGSPEELSAFIGDRFPAVAAGLEQFDDPILPYFDAIVAGLEAHQGDFQRADAIPTSWLPATSVTFIVLLLGLVITGLAGWTLVRGATWGPAALTVVGVAIVAVALVLQVPTKSKSVDDLTDAFRDVFTTEGAQLARDRYEVVAATGAELQSVMVPALAEALGMTPDELGAFLGDQFPAVATGLAELDGILVRFDGLVSAVEANVDSFQKADSIPTAGLPTVWFPWHLLAPGIVLAVGGGAAVWLDRRSRATDPAAAVA